MALGLSVKEFVETKLGLNYNTYQYRVREGKLHLADYHKIMYYTGRSFDELWPSSLGVNRSIRIPINLGGQASPVVPGEANDAPSFNPAGEDKKGGAHAAPPAPDDIYDGGLPPLD